MKWADVKEGDVIHYREKHSYLILDSHVGRFKLLHLNDGDVIEHYDQDPFSDVDPFFWRVEDR